MVAAMETRICAADDCETTFDPKIPEQKFCSNRCASRVRVRRLRDRRRHQNLPGPGGGPPNGGLLATLGGAVDYGQDGSASDKNRYSVKSNTRKPAQSVPDQPHQVAA
jgi:hypothetical protein